MNIILFCLPNYGKKIIKNLIEQGTPPSFIVAPARNYPSFDDTLKVAHENNLPVLFFEKSPTEETFVRRINELSPDLIIVAAYPHLIPKSVYSAAKIAAVNAHPSLLPHYRGPNPFYHVVAQGEKITGVTLHLLDQKFDTGNIICQTEVPLSIRETTGLLEKKLAHVVVDMVAEFINTVDTSGLPQTSQQDKLKVYNKAPLVNLPLPPLDWTLPARKIDQLVRAANPYFTLVTILGGRAITIFSGRPVKNYQTQSVAGTIEVIDEKGMLVSTGDGAYLVTCIEYPTYWKGDPAGLALLTAGDTFSSKG